MKSLNVIVGSKYDVIVVGPAGTTVAYALAKKGINVLLLEKENFPRIKSCGGGVTAKAAQLLPFDFQSVIENTISGIKYSWKLGPEKERTYGKPLMHLVSRDRFDDFLLLKAREAGTVVMTGAGVESIERTADSVIVRTANETYSARIVVGADGPNGITAKSLGLMRKCDNGVGLDCQVVPKNYDPEAWKGFVKFDYGDIPGGYGWVFPKKEMLSIGVGGLAGDAKKLKPYLQRLIERQDLGPFEIKSLKGHIMPVRRKGSPITGDRVLLVGDAAGLVEPFSGEGMYNAILSGQIAAEVIADYLKDPSVGLSRYEKRIDEEIMPESYAAWQILKLSRMFPKTSFGLLNSNDRVWNAVCRVLRGDKKYSEFKDVLGPGRVVFDCYSSRSFQRSAVSGQLGDKKNISTLDPSRNRSRPGYRAGMTKRGIGGGERDCRVASLLAKTNSFVLDPGSWPGMTWLSAVGSPAW